MKFGIEFKTLDGNKLSFVADEKLLIGRSSSCNVVIQEEGISRRHCLIEQRDGDLYITDLNSANGVMIDEKRLPSGEPQKFFLTSKLHIGPLEVTELQVYDGAAMPSIPSEETDPGVSTKAPLQSPRKSRTPRIGSKNNTDSSSLHPSIKAMLILIFLGSLYGGYKFIFAEETIDLDKILFDSYLKNKKEDGSIKTINF